ncbi:MAG: hypothetical protein H7A25_01025 [Leptospiraceae bacterium]|nr:hypothetical protein [Leptospiraceae bacterium]
MNTGVETPVYGLALRLGPANIGFLFEGGESKPGLKDKGKGIGLRGGYIGAYHSSQLVFGFLGGETFYPFDLQINEKKEILKGPYGLPLQKAPRNELKSYSFKYLKLYHDPPSERKKRKKEKIRKYLIDELSSKNPDTPLDMYLPPENPKPNGYPVSYYFELGIVGGAYGGGRFGINLAEFCDFLLGFFTVDLLKDDVESKIVPDPAN